MAVQVTIGGICTANVLAQRVSRGRASSAVHCQRLSGKSLSWTASRTEVPARS